MNFMYYVEECTLSKLVPPSCLFSLFLLFFFTLFLSDEKRENYNRKIIFLSNRIRLVTLAARKGKRCCGAREAVRLLW
jgi:hypothetical protein